MTIEVRQLLVKSTVAQRTGGEGSDRPDPADRAELKAEILAECREMLTELLVRRKER